MKEKHSQQLHLNYQVTSEAHCTLQPQTLHLLGHKNEFESYAAPMKYMGDALVGLSFLKLYHHTAKHFTNSSHFTNPNLVQDSWLALDPHHEIYNRTQPRISALKKSMKNFDPKDISAFENSFEQIVSAAFDGHQMHFNELFALIDSIAHLEDKIDSPLLYNFRLTLDRKTIEKMHSLYSLLYHLRSLVAIEYNNHTTDPSQEAVKMDAITDYLPKPEYIVNDALLYWSYKKACHKYSSGAKRDAHFETHFMAPMDENFQNFLHNGSRLVENLPKSFLNNLKNEELYNGLHLTQMDWLLGTEAGLLFKIREELFGLRDGYDNIFWQDITRNQNSGNGEQALFQVHCALKESEIFPSVRVA
jgi:hypothetical protein